MPQNGPGHPCCPVRAQLSAQKNSILYCSVSDADLVTYHRSFFISHNSVSSRADTSARCSLRDTCQSFDQGQPYIILYKTILGLSTDMSKFPEKFDNELNWYSHAAGSVLLRVHTVINKSTSISVQIKFKLQSLSTSRVFLVPKRDNTKRPCPLQGPTPHLQLTYQCSLWMLAGLSSV
jgi:hypothetical protein